MISLKLKCLRLFFPGEFNQQDFAPLRTQTSGKREFLRHKNGGRILKPYPRRSPLAEEEFYKWIFGLRQLTSPDLKEFVPEFYGVLSSNHFSFVVLEDVTRKFKFPSLADVKIGAKTWISSECFIKVAKEKLLYPIGQSLGFRLTGVKMFRNSTGTYKKIPFWKVRRLSKENLFSRVVTPFFSYENGAVRFNVVREVLRRLSSIKNWFFEHNTHFQLISSSILIVYETTPDYGGPQLVDVRMIDFAHVSTKAELVPGGFQPTLIRSGSGEALDTNYLFGLQSFIEFIERLLPAQVVSDETPLKNCVIDCIS